MKLFVFVFAVVTVYVDAQVKCPIDYFAADNSCWVIPHQKAKWTDAESACKAFHGDLAVISDQQIWNDLGRAISRSKGDKFWVGATDMFVEGDWLWAPTEGRVNLNFLGGSVRDNAKDKNCMYIQQHSSHLYAEECEEEFYFICQHPPISVETGTSVVG